MKTGRARGLATLDANRRREIASKGGRAAHAAGLAHTFTTDEAREAGRKGGAAVSRDRQHMADIGRRGGHVTQDRRQDQPPAAVPVPAVPPAVPADSLLVAPGLAQTTAPGFVAPS